MSTDITQTAQSSVAVEEEPARQFSLKALAETAKALRQAPTLEELNAWLRQLQIHPEELLPYRAFKPGTYARHLVFRNQFVEILVLCWKPGQRTPIHDHNGSCGAVRVCEGVLWETMFALNDERKLYYKSGCEWTSGYVTGADVPDIHQLGNPEVSGQDLVTLHMYSPPLGVLNTYKVGSSEVGHYSPDEFMDGAGI